MVLVFVLFPLGKRLFADSTRHPKRAIINRYVAQWMLLVLCAGWDHAQTESPLLIKSEWPVEHRASQAIHLWLSGLGSSVAEGIRRASWAGGWHSLAVLSGYPSDFRLSSRSAARLLTQRVCSRHSGRASVTSLTGVQRRARSLQYWFLKRDNESA